MNLILLAALMLAGCGSGAGQVAPSDQAATLTRQAGSTEASEATTSALETEAPEAVTEPLPAGTETPEPTQAPEPSPTVDTRLPPEEWRDWPIIPTLSPSMLEVYQRGQQMGNDPNAFSVVGDCQNIPPVFMGRYDSPGTYILPDENGYLQDTIDQFAGSFERYGYALHGGFTFPSIFSPMRADPNYCDSGETPLECEFRIHRPVIAFISMEAWYSGRTTESYERYLRQAVEYALSRGIIPILATKADHAERDNSIGIAIARAAYDYQVPLWNFWLAVQPLPAHGLDWESDPSGFQLTEAGFYMRGFTALQVLDALWREILAASP
jgi:hypothetical protein